MKLLIVLSVIACGYADKLDRTYLPPANAATSGGSPGSLNTPLAASAFGQPAGFGQGRSLGAPGKAAPFGASGNSGFGAPSNQYNQPGSAQSGFPGQTVGPNFDAGFAAPAQNFGNQAQDYQRSQPPRAQASAEKNAEILRYDSQNDGETFNYSFETSNGISAEESGVATNGVQAQGAFAYTDDDGQMFRVAYTADENGYQPQGDHLPTPPPIPEEILKSIEENARAAAAGTQEGAYNPNEDNDVTPNQQYNANVPGSYNYGTSNAAARPQTGAQGFQAGPSQQYGAPNAGSARSLNGFGQNQAKPSQVYGSPSSGGLPGSNAAARPNNFGQPQGPQQFTPSGPTSSASNFGSSGPASQASPNQYQASSSGQLPSARGLQGSGSAQAQDASGYQYNQPQAGFAGNAKNGPSNQQFQPQGGAPTAPQGYSRPSGFPVASGASGQGAFGSAAQPKSQGGFGSAPRPKSQGGFESAPSSGSYGSAPVSQGSFAPASQGSFAPSGPSGFSGPNGPSGPKGPSSFGANSQGSSGPNGPSGPKGPSSFGANSQGSFGSPTRPTSTYGTPSGSQPSFGGSSTGFSKPGARNLMPESGYEYNRPSSQFGGSQQPQGGNQFGGPQNGNAFGGASQKGFQSANQGRPGQTFGGPRAPPSFTEEEGYKY